MNNDIKPNLLKPRWSKVRSDLWDDKTRSGLVIASIAVGVFAIGMIITAFVIFLPLFLLGQLFINAHAAVRYLFYLSITVLFAIQFFILLASYPLLLTIPLLIYLGVIILLNQRFYRFLLHKRGINFAVAALPMQLLYYLYSFAAFAIVTLVHTWSIRIHRKQVS